MAHRIVKFKKFHTIAEELIIPAAVNLLSMMIEGAAEKLKMVPLLDDTKCCQIGDMAQDIHNQLIDEIKQREFGLQLNEAIDGSRDAQLICYL